MDSIDDAKRFLRENIDEGCKCPVCGQEVKLYKRVLNAQMAWFLIALFRAPKLDGNWVDIKALDVRGGDYAKTRYWQLVEVKDNDDPTRRSSGLWRLTQKGVQFVHDQVRVPRHALVYNGKCQGFSSQDIGIRQALGATFDYGELMS